MPVMRGRDAARIIREMGYRGTIIGVTANVLQSDIEDFIAQGADYVIKKPMSTEKFNLVLRDIHGDAISAGGRRSSVFPAYGVFSRHRSNSKL